MRAIIFGPPARAATSISYWLLALLVLGFFQPCMLAAQPLSEQSIQNEGGDQREESSGQHQAVPFSLPVRIVEEPVETEGAQRDQQETRQREIEDLATQQSVAKSTEEIVWLTKWQVALGAIGAIGLFYTLYLSRTSTAAAVRAVEIADTTAKQQLRAYLLLEFTRIHIDDTGIGGVILTFKNSGQTPAKDVIIYSKAKGKVPGEMFSLEGLIQDLDASKFSVAAQGMRDKRVGPFTASETEALITGETEIIIWGRFEYLDIFGMRHGGDFRLIGGGKDGFLHGNALIVTADGNSED